LKEFGLNVHAADSVKSRAECSIMARIAPTIWRAIVPHGPNFHHGQRGMTDRHLPAKHLPNHAPQTPLRG
jgi:hypothetical protein